MTKRKFLSAALISAVVLATPAMARERHMRSQHSLSHANASTTSEARYFGEGDGFRGYEGHDVWGHLGTYYGPMVPSIP
jgi:hypothetical protein